MTSQCYNLRTNMALLCVLSNGSSVLPLKSYIDYSTICSTIGLNNKVGSALDSNLYREAKVQMEVVEPYTDVAVSSALVSMAVQDMSAVELVENTVDTSEELKAAAETCNHIQLLAQIGRLPAAVVERKASCMVGHIVKRHWEEAVAVVDSLSHNLDSKELVDADMK